ncbi:hypothetical protein COCOBI_14-3900 [Coccomyxa sp. Obi]|nr:hypothetical protein COCOBI_14-3900 [Coccomyxa sp. Obi]
MSSIGEKIKDKLHMGRSSGDGGGSSTMTANSTKATSVPGTTTTGSYGRSTNTDKINGTGIGTHTSTPGYKTGIDHKTHTEDVSMPRSTATNYDKVSDTRTGAAATEGAGRVGAACDTKYYTTVEDRPVEKEVIERVVEHHPVEKKFVVETRPAGEHELTDKRKDESLGIREEIKGAAPKSSPCEGGPKLVVQK